MWTTEKNENAKAPHKVDVPKNAGQHNRVLWMQCLLCILALGWVLVLRAVSPNGFIKFSSGYLDYINTGAAMTSEDEIFRFASRNLKFVQSALRTFVAELDGEPSAQGGQYELTHATYLKTVTLSPYHLSDRPLLPVPGTVSSKFGYRIHPITAQQDFHTGIDLAVPKHTPVQAAYGGIVAETGSNAINGNYISAAFEYGLYGVLSFGSH
ncbi:MAG: M23 family metallopeptidase [Pygmaiobacter sp.]